MDEIKLGILTEFKNGHKKYIDACEELGVKYEIIDFLSNNWIDEIKNKNCTGYLVRPSYAKKEWKTLYDERLFFLNKVMKKPIFPSYLECFLYENKKNMHYWLEINNIKHAKTNVFYNREDAFKFLKDIKYPLIFKPNTGSSSIGVKRIKNYRQGKKIVNKCIARYKSFARGYTKWYSYSKIPFIKVPILDDKQYNFVMFQEFIKIKYEWRIINIGDSYFGHQKLENKKGLHSGTGLVGWQKPPEKLLNFVRNICKIGNFKSMDCDVFETIDGEYYVNELQTIFGSYNNSQMYIDNVPGRYKFINNKWIFEEGFFNTNASNNLRVETFLKELEKKKNKKNLVINSFVNKSR